MTGGLVWTHKSASLQQQQKQTQPVSRGGDVQRLSEAAGASCNRQPEESSVVQVEGQDQAQSLDPPVAPIDAPDQATHNLRTVFNPEKRTDAQCSVTKPSDAPRPSSSHTLCVSPLSSAQACYTCFHIVPFPNLLS